MKCPKCQHENPDEAKFCIECGNPIEFRCPKCGAHTPKTSKFCMECGYKLIPSSEPALKDLSFDEKIEKIQKYLPGGLTEKILSQRGKIEGEKKQVTVMFCDLQGFTPLVEKLGAEEAYSIMDLVYEILIHNVYDYEGTVNEMTGDGIMALFGAPIALEDAPQRAIRSAHAIHREIARLGNTIKQKRVSTPPLKMRIGIHTGSVVVGTLGNDLRVEFKAVGDTVNLASRMEDMAEPGSIYVTEETFKLTEGLFHYESLGEKEIKGKEEPVKTYRVIGPSTRRTRFEVSADRGLTPLVGRERALELLLDAFDNVKEGRGQAVSIVSEAGVGKSRLLYEFRKALINEDVTFLMGRCLSYSKEVPYHLHVDVLRANFDIRDTDSPSEIRDKVRKGLKILGADEASTLPYLLELFSVTESGAEDISLRPEVKRDRIVEALKRIVLKGSELRPLILAYEDLHWIDTSSEAVLMSGLEIVPGARVLMIFTYRPEYIQTWAAKSFHNQITLNRLSNRESLSMVSHLLGTEEIDDDLEELILKKTEGIPFFIEELIKSLLDLTLIEKRDSIFDISKRAKDLVIPSTIQDVIMARVDQMPESAKEVIQTGAVIGREFSQDLIKLLLGMEEQELLSNLAILKDSELVYEKGVYPETRYHFRHSLTHEVVYDTLLHRRRKEIHERIGDAIETLYANRLKEFYEILAYHYSKTDNQEKIYDYFKLSGEKAEANYSNLEAFRFYKEALIAINKLPESKTVEQKRLDILRSLINPIIMLNFPEDTLQTLKDGEQLALEMGDEKSIREFHFGIGMYHAYKGEPLLYAGYSEKYYREAEEIQDHEALHKHALLLCQGYQSTGQSLKVMNITIPLIDRIEKTKSERHFHGLRVNSYSYFCALTCLNMAMVGNFKEAKVYYEKGLRNAIEIGDLTTLAYVYIYSAFFFNIKGDGNSGITHAQKSIQYCEKMDSPTTLGIAHNGLGGAYLIKGDYKTALYHIEKSYKILQDIKWDNQMIVVEQALSNAHFNLGNLKESQRLCDSALAKSLRINNRVQEASCRIQSARILHRLDPSQNDKAIDIILQAIKVLHEFGHNPTIATAYLWLTGIYRDIGQREKSIETLNRANDMFQEMEMDFWLNITKQSFEYDERKKWYDLKRGMVKDNEYSHTIPPLFTFEFPPGSTKIETDGPAQVMAMQTPGGVTFQASVDDMPRYITLEDVGPKLYAPVLNSLGSEVTVVSNKEIKLKDNTQAFRTDITWLWKDGATWLTTLIVSAFKNGKWVYLTVHPWQNPNEVAPIVESLTFN